MSRFTVDIEAPSPRDFLREYTPKNRADLNLIIRSGRSHQNLRRLTALAIPHVAPIIPKYFPRSLRHF